MKWIVKCLRNYANFRGRASRTEFWYFVLFLFLYLLVVAGIFLLCGDSSKYSAKFAGLPFLLPYLSVMVRRLHDIGRSGWWAGGYLLVFVASWAAGIASGKPGYAEWWSDAELAIVMLQAVYLVAMLYWLCKVGDPEANRYGEPPCSEPGR